MGTDTTDTQARENRAQRGWVPFLAFGGLDGALAPILDDAVNRFPVNESPGRLSDVGGFRLYDLLTVLVVAIGPGAAIEHACLSLHELLCLLALAGPHRLLLSIDGGADGLMNTFLGRKVVGDIIGREDVLEFSSEGKLKQMNRAPEVAVQPGILGNRDGVTLIGLDRRKQTLVARTVGVVVESANVVIDKLAGNLMALSLTPSTQDA